MSKIINGISVAVLTATQATVINHARQHSANKDERRQIKREMFAVVKDKYGIPSSVKLKVNTTGADQKGYLVLTLGGKGGRANKHAIQLGTDGKYAGLVPWASLFPPPAPVVEQPAAAPASSVFGSVAPAKWFRLDPGVVALALTEGYDDVPDAVPDVAGGDLPTPHLMLHGRTDLAITADGSIYRKQ